MKKTLTLLFCLLSCGLNLYAWELTTEDLMGAAYYKEEESNIKSDWRAFYNETEFALSDYDNKRFEGEANIGFLAAVKSREKWDYFDSEYQTNDMSLWGLDLNTALGYALILNNTESAAIAPLVGYGYKFIRFTRSNFNILNIITITEIVDEDYQIHHLDGGFRLSCKTTERLEFVGKAVFGWVFYNAAKNSALGTVKGDGGYILKFDAGLNYAATKHLTLGASFYSEFQHLDGGSSGIIIWPNNDLNVLGGKIVVKYVF